ncbi:WhiB family transcriptional regulator [Gordonia rubripertincta]|uniref:WhiB family transcriptional regulator n=1 Tax=Gordonia rubripertincta TaxID=36822 RepID=A0AAW6R4Z2_GORRU|nr:WhiB family transcriptional regulator [Gordonia rubripertincta]MDG6779583.1 WhiB family transcriptional regulator [Gordonia rubripertincta]NKY62889.1 WhiB family transcriptional regulator [Gordonia rubripertincta]
MRLNRRPPPEVVILRGLCAGDPELFDPPATTARAAADRIEKAKRTCHACPVLAECRAWAQSLPRNSLSGVVAGKRYGATIYKKPRTKPA